MENFWSEEELRTLKEKYPLCKRINEILPFLPNRGINAIKAKANELGLKTRFFWSKEETEILKKIYPTTPNEKIAKILKREKREIHDKAISLGLKKLNLTIWGKSEIKPLKDIDKAYIAGFLDGEGYIGVEKHEDHFLTRVTISNTHKGVIEKIREITGIGTIAVRKEDYRYKTCYVWRLHKQIDMLEFLETIKDFLIVKKEQAELMIKLLKLKKNRSKYSKPTKEELEIAEKLRELNKRGLS